MKRILWALVSLVAIGLGVAAMLNRRAPEWTTGSAEAREEFELCLDAYVKFYRDEAREHCERALELDPDFVMAKLSLSRSSPRDGSREALLEELQAADLEPLTPRERFLVQYVLARENGADGGAAQLLEDYLERYPHDPFALDARCAELWERREWEEAGACYRRLLEVDPNWVQAQNHLGYVAMSQGLFSEAERHFETYRYVAPDQANPHDSLGELLTLVGRYDEAERQFEQAIATRRTFCASYIHLTRVHRLSGRFDRAVDVLQRMEEANACGAEEQHRAWCQVKLWQAASSGDWEGVWRSAERGCLGGGGDVMILSHEAAVKTGRMDAARGIEEDFATELSANRGAYRDILKAVLSHMEAQRLEAEGSSEEAAAKYQLADEKLRYWDYAGLGIFKLFNQRSLARLLSALGREAEAEKVWARIRSVNPRFLEDYPRGGRGELEAAQPVR